MDEYTIEGKPVSAEDYQTFRKTLVEIEDTYHCAKTVGGGRNSYKAKDLNGVVWICKSVTTKEKTVKSIDKD